jgi:hypothetical protein
VPRNDDIRNWKYLRIKPVSVFPNGFYPIRKISQLAAQPPDMGIQRPRGLIRGFSPDDLPDVFTRDYGAAF